MSKTKDKVLSQLLDTMHRTLPYFDQPESALSKRYAPGKWTAREVLVHLADTEGVLLDRLRRLASEDNPTLMAFDQDKWQKQMFYSKRDLTVARMNYEASRRSIVELIRNLPESVNKRTGTHSEAGKLSFGLMLDRVTRHNAHHLEQIKAAVEGRPWKKK
jgi:hypothetical protein